MVAAHRTDRRRPGVMLLLTGRTLTRDPPCDGALGSPGQSRRRIARAAVVTHRPAQVLHRQLLGLGALEPALLVWLRERSELSMVAEGELRNPSDEVARACSRSRPPQRVRAVSAQVQRDDGPGRGRLSTHRQGDPRLALYDEDFAVLLKAGRSTREVQG